MGRQGGARGITTAACPGCGLVAARQNGRDRQGRQLHQCRGCRRRFTARSATPFAGYRFPPAVSALARRWYLRQRLRYADVAALLAERGVRVDASTVCDWGRACAPRDADAARPFRRPVGSSWGGDGTDTTIADKPAYGYRAIDGQGQVVDVSVRRRRATAAAAACFRRASAAMGVVPDEGTTAGAAASPPALAAGRPGVRHEPGKAVRQRIARDHQPLKGRLRPLRGFKTLVGARVRCTGQAFLRNRHGGCDDCGRLVDAASASTKPPVVHVWAALTSVLLAR